VKYLLYILNLEFVKKGKSYLGGFMSSVDNYRDVFLEQYNEYAQYEMPATLIVAPYLFRQSTQDEDHNGIDVVAKYRKLAVRTRKYAQDVFEKYKNEFTIRSEVPSKNPTELDKLYREQHADAMVYCWEEEGKIKEWTLLDLKIVAGHIRFMHLNKILKFKCPEIDSPNGTKFIACKFEDFPGALIASSF
jgi:hypothetical protein